MITGTVSATLDPIVRLTVRGPTGRSRRIRAVVDTGFNGTLTLPSILIAELELPWDRRANAELADGSQVVFDVHKAVVVWNRRRRMIRVDSADSAPLIGMELLHGFELNMKVQRRGRVTIKPLRRRRGRTA